MASDAARSRDGGGREAAAQAGPERRWRVSHARWPLPPDSAQDGGTRGDVREHVKDDSSVGASTAILSSGDNASATLANDGTFAWAHDDAKSSVSQARPSRLRIPHQTAPAL